MFRSNRYLLLASTIGIVSILCLLLLYRQLAISALVDHETRANEALTRVMANVVWSDYRQLIEADRLQIQIQGGDHPAILGMDLKVRKIMRGSRVVKVRMYDQNGITIFSTDPKQISEVSNSNEGFRAAIGGEGISIVTSIPIIATTTSSSIRVKQFFFIIFPHFVHVCCT